MDKDVNDPKHASSSVKHSGVYIIAWPCMADSDSWIQIFIDDVIHDDRSRMNTEVYGNIVCQCRKNFSRLISGNLL